MDIREIIRPFLLKVPSYAYSHIYDMVVYEIGVLAAVLVCFFKDPIKRAIRKRVYQKTEIDVKAKREPDEEKSKPVRSAIMKYRRLNMVIILIAGVLSEILFQIFAAFSPRIKAFTLWTFIAFIVPVAVYTFMEMLISGWIGRIAVVVLFFTVLNANAYYCLIHESHHKACYAIKAFVVLFGILGIIIQFFYVKKYNKPVKVEKEDRLDLDDIKKTEESKE